VKCNVFSFITLIIIGFNQMKLEKY